MQKQVLYQDKTIILTAKDIKILNYYFFGVHKTISLSQIKQVKIYKLTICLKYRLAGGSYKYWWHYFPFDTKRKDKQMFITFYLDCLWKPCVTPERPRQLFEALQKIVPKVTDMIDQKGQQFGEKEQEIDSLQKQA